MRKTSRIQLIAIPVVVAVNVMSQSRGADEPRPAHAEPAPADASKIAGNETLYLCLQGNPNSLNSILMSSEPEEKLKSLYCDFPFVFDDRLGWRVHSPMVESYTEAPDHLTAVLKLKKGLKWHDGHPFTADDIVFSWRQIIDENVPAVGARTGPDQIADCVAPDPCTVRFVHKAALPTNKWNVMFSLIPKHLYETEKQKDPTLSTSDYYNKLNRNPIGNGPYRFVEWIPDDKIVFERWEEYPGPRPHFKRVVCRLLPDAQTRLPALERGDIDETPLLPQQFAREASSDGFRKTAVTARSPRWNYHYICWNMDGLNPFFADVSVRRAMCLAVNHELIVTQVYYGLYEQSHGLFHPTSPAFNPEIERFTYNPAESEALLDKAGWIKDVTDGWRYRDAGRDAGRAGATVRVKFSFTLLLPQSDSATRTAAILQDDLRRIGVEMKTRVLEWATFLSTIRKHEFEAHYSSMTSGADPDNVWNLFHSKSRENERNYGGYSNQRVDELLALGRACFDDSKRMRHYAELSKLIYEEAPCTFLVDAPSLWGLNRRLRGVAFSARGPFMFHPGVLDWWVPISFSAQETPIP